jgi:electron transfer flavoprotein alpha subunit
MAQEDKGIWVFAEHRKGELLDVSLELLGEGRRLAERLGGEVAAILLGNGLEQLVEPLAHYGADRVHLVEGRSLEEFASDTYVEVITGLVQKSRPRVLLAGATWQTRDFLPRLAARMGMAFAADYSKVVTDAAGALEVTRPIYGGKLDGVYTIVPQKTNSMVATATPGAIGMEKPDLAKKSELNRIEAKIDSHGIRTRVIDFIKGDPRKMDIRQAEIVVAAGRGMGCPETLAVVQELADLLGACVAGTRPAVDAGWLPFERQVGQTGKSVSPKLYIACGVSGAIQHTLGMKDSKHIIAINKDPDAPIFKICELGIVADVNEAIPKLMDRLQQIFGSGGAQDTDSIIHKL